MLNVSLNLLQVKYCLVYFAKDVGLVWLW